MKHCFFILCTILTFSLKAQEKPHWLISADGELTAETALGQTLYNINLGVSGGYFIYEGLLLGTELRGEWDVTSRYYEVVPTIRYYVFIKEHHAVYAGAKYGYGWGTDINVFSNSDVARNANIWGVRMGYLSRFNEHVALDVFLFHSTRASANQKGDGSWTERTTTTQFGLGLGLQVFL